MNKSRNSIYQLIDQIEPFDDKERVAQQMALTWVQGEAGLFRNGRPDVPSPHLVSYFVLVDFVKAQLLLVHHRKADLWLPTGGHVEVDEHPRLTVKRELDEELGPRVGPYAAIADRPLFITATETRGPHSHTDVSLWYTVSTLIEAPLAPDEREFYAHKWQTFGEVLATDIVQLDPQMHRFVHKLKAQTRDG